MTNVEDDAAPEWATAGADTGAGADRSGDQQVRGPDGRFREGASGNPAGRRPGSRNRASLVLDALADGEAESVLQAMVERAKQGDLRAAEFVLARAWPARRPMSGPECPLCWPRRPAAPWAVHRAGSATGRPWRAFRAASRRTRAHLGRERRRERRG